MSRAEYLASYVISRLVLLTIEAGVLVGFSIADVRRSDARVVVVDRR